jgi:hypothetical protein
MKVASKTQDINQQEYDFVANRNLIFSCHVVIGEDVSNVIDSITTVFSGEHVPRFHESLK